MAFNGYRLNYPTTQITYNNNDSEEVNSILSDSQQSSWVLFNPSESDILSSTNTNNPSVNTNEESLQQQRSQNDNQLEQNSDSQGNSDVDTDIEEDSLIDNFSYDTPSQLRLERLFQNPLKDRVNKWNKNLIDTEFFDDNIASWDLDENLSNNYLDNSILKMKEFYGDDIIKNMSKAEFRRFKTIERNLRNYLNRKPNPILYQVLLKMMPPNNNSQTPPPPMNRSPSYNKMLNSIINNHYNNFNHIEDKLLTKSDTASSSLVICGGNESWNDI